MEKNGTLNLLIPILATSLQFFQDRLNSDLGAIETFLMRLDNLEKMPTRLLQLYGRIVEAPKRVPKLARFKFSHRFNPPLTLYPRSPAVSSSAPRPDTSSAIRESRR